MNLKDFLNREIREDEINDVAAMDAPRVPLKTAAKTEAAAPAKNEEDGGTLSLF